MHNIDGWVPGWGEGGRGLGGGMGVLVVPFRGYNLWFGTPKGRVLSLKILEF